MENYKLIIIIILGVIGYILQDKKNVNKKAIIDCIFFIIIIGFLLVTDILILNLAISIFRPYDINLIIFLIFIFGGLTLLVILLLKNHIYGGIRTINYLLNKNNYITNGTQVTGIIIDIKHESTSKYYIKYYLIVEIENKIVKSTYYLEKEKYRIGEQIKLLKYNNKYLVLLD